MWGSLQKFASSALAALPSKEDLMKEVEKVKVFGDLDSLKDSPSHAAQAQRRLHARDLGLTFASDRLILMGRPHVGTTGSGRVDIDSASEFFRCHYPGKFMVWNLANNGSSGSVPATFFSCPEEEEEEEAAAGRDPEDAHGGPRSSRSKGSRSGAQAAAYDTGKFDDQVIAYDLQSHPVPPLGLLVKVCMSIASWLRGDPGNVAVIHCSNGRVCTTAVASCYLAWAKAFPDTGRAFAEVCRRRAAAARRQITAAELATASSHRYLKYFNSILSGVRPQGHMLILTRVIVNDLPAIDSDGTTTLNLTVHKGGSMIYDHELLAGIGDDDHDHDHGHDDKNGTARFGSGSTDTGLPRHTVTEGALKFDLRVPLQGDIIMEFIHTPRAAVGNSTRGGDAGGDDDDDDGMEDTRNGDGVAREQRKRARRKRAQRPRVLFSCAFHTGYIVDNVLSLPKSELDFRCEASGQAAAGGGGGSSNNSSDGSTASRFGDGFSVDLIFSSVEDSNAQLDRISSGAPKTEGSLEVQAMDLSAFESMIGEHSNFWDDIRTRRDHAAVTVSDVAQESSSAVGVVGAPSAAANGEPGGAHRSPSCASETSASASAPAPRPRRAEIHIEDDDPSFAQDDDEEEEEEPLPSDSGSEEEEQEQEQEQEQDDGELHRDLMNHAAANDQTLAGLTQGVSDDRNNAVSQFRDLESKLGLDRSEDSHPADGATTTAITTSSGASSALASSSSSAVAGARTPSEQREGAASSVLLGETQSSEGTKTDEVQSSSAADFDDSSFNLGAMDAELAALGVLVAPNSGTEGSDDDEEAAEPSLGNSLAGLDTDGVLVESHGTPIASTVNDSDDDDFEDLENYLANLDV